MDPINLKLIFSLLVPLVTGYSFLLFLFKAHHLSFLLKISFAYAVGIGFLTLWMFILGVLSIPFSIPAIALPLMIFSFFCILLSIKHPRDQNRTKNFSLPSLTPWILCLWAILLIDILINTYYIFWNALNIPVHTWDAISTIAYKAKIFYYEKGIPPLNELPHPTYPLLVPLSETWIAVATGAWNDQTIKIIFPFAFLSYLIVQLNFITSRTNISYALFAGALLLSSNFFVYHAAISYRDFLLMYYNCLTLLLLLFWNQTRAKEFLILASLMAGFGSFTKLEGTSFLAIYFVLFLFLNQANQGLKDTKTLVKNFLYFSIPGFLIAGGYHLYKIANGVLTEGTDIINKTGVEINLEKLSLLPSIIEAFWDNLFFSGNWGITWFVLLVTFLLWKKKKDRQETEFCSVALLLFFALYTAIALFTSNYEWVAGNLKSTTLSRLILHFYPLTSILITLLLHSGLEDLLSWKKTSSRNPK